MPDWKPFEMVATFGIEHRCAAVVAAQLLGDKHFVFDESGLAKFADHLVFHPIVGNDGALICVITDRS